MGLFSKFQQTIQKGVDDAQVSISDWQSSAAERIENPDAYLQKRQDRINRLTERVSQLGNNSGSTPQGRQQSMTLVPHNEANLQGESVAVQKIHKLIYDSITKGYFNMESVRIISSIIERLQYPLADKAIADLFAVLDPIYQRNFNEYGECTCDSDSPDEIEAKNACIQFNNSVEARVDDGLGPYHGKSFDVKGKFNFGTHAEVSDRVTSIGLSVIPGAPTTYYADYIFIGCKPTKKHPSEDFSDCLTCGMSRVKDEDGFYRSYILEYDFGPLKE